MKKATPIPETLAGMYHTDIPFLEGNKVPVIKRKFNWIPTGEKGDPPRALTDQPPLKTHFYEQHVVASDFPKTMAYRMYGDGFKQFPDGTYHDAVMGLDEDYEERQKALKQVFAPSDVYMFMRADRENYTQEMIKDYFRAKYEEREEAEEMFLQNYGLLPHEVKTVMAQRRVEAAAKALETAKTTNKLSTYRPGMTFRREDLIADRFMTNGLPLFSADDTHGAGNAQPWARGNEDWTRGYDETSPYARKTPGAMTREQRKQMADEFNKKITLKRAMDAIREVSESKDEGATIMGGGAGRETVSDVITTAATVSGETKKLFSVDSIKQVLSPEDFKAFDAEMKRLRNLDEKGVRQKRTALVNKYGITKTMAYQAYGMNKNNFA